MRVGGKKLSPGRFLESRLLFFGLALGKCTLKPDGLELNCVYKVFVQKQPLEVFCTKRCFENFEACNFIKKRL